MNRQVSSAYLFAALPGRSCVMLCLVFRGRLALQHFLGCADTLSVDRQTSGRTGGKPRQRKRSPDREAWKSN